MELREFASRVLYSTSLEEKLLDPGEITDEKPGLQEIVPDMPGRPVDLRFKPVRSGGGEFPGTRLLEQPEHRGRLLHFFANHELLATELMALVLLRFPDAPPAFRRGVLRTLREEQEHTRLYMERMRDCGIRLGDLPVSGYFWRTLSTMRSPMDFVSGLSLTFEQANLDFCRHFATCFGMVGDTDTSALLDQIYRDEIAHVAHGLKWFRRWKAPGASDWSAYCRQLKFPLTPGRARGIGYNEEGRRAAGLDAEFIRELSVQGQSKGRPPSVFVFNPLSEGHIARGLSWTPVKEQAEMADDLETLPLFLCRKDDVVLVRRQPSAGFLEGVRDAGFALPEWVLREGWELGASHPLRERRLGRFRPWAWGPDSASLFASLTPRGGYRGGGRDDVPKEERREEVAANDARQIPVHGWGDGVDGVGVRELYSKVWSANFLRRFLLGAARGDGSEGFADEGLVAAEQVGVEVTTVEDARRVVERIRRGGHHRVVVKAAWGLAGRGQVRLWEPELLTGQIRWMERQLEAGISLVVEPWLERVADVSVQFEMGEDEMERIGFTRLHTDVRGQYLGNDMGSRWRRQMPLDLVELFPEIRRIHPLMNEMWERLQVELGVALKEKGYRGPVGVDAFVFKGVDGRCRFKPVVEINPRYTMGRVALELMRHAAPGSEGRLALVSEGRVREKGFDSLTGFARHVCEIWPMERVGEPVLMMRRGCVILNETEKAKRVMGLFLVGSLREMGSLGID